MQFRQRRGSAVFMMIQRRTARPSDVEKTQFAVKEAPHGGLVGGVEDRAAGTAAARDLVS
jgi:hypothetical protein